MKIHIINTIIWGVVIGGFVKLIIPNDLFLRGYIIGASVMMVYFVGLFFINQIRREAIAEEREKVINEIKNMPIETVGNSAKTVDQIIRHLTQE